jgi:hypothetical protein
MGNIHHTARVIRNPGSYAAAGAIHGGMGLFTILFKMAVVWPAIMCWWMIYYPFIWAPIRVYQEVQRNRQAAGLVQHTADGRRIPTEAERDQMIERSTRFSREHFARAKAAEAHTPYWEPPSTR